MQSLDEGSWLCVHQLCKLSSPVVYWPGIIFYPVTTAIYKTNRPTDLHVQD